jgi:hypothetical protein
MPFIRTKSGVIHINMGRTRRKRCHFCNRFADKLCDFPVRRGKTCDADICSRCATSIGDNLDYCPRHKGQQPAQASLPLEGVA